MYKAEIGFAAYEDVFADGESPLCDNAWTETITAATLSELRNKVLEVTYSKREDLDDEQINEYDFATEYHTSYLANANNEGDATEVEIKSWKQGKTRLWAVNCQILVSEVTETRASL